MGEKDRIDMSKKECIEKNVEHHFAVYTFDIYAKCA